MTNIFESIKGPLSKYKLKSLMRLPKRIWQRATKGYCDLDVWDIDQYFLSILPAMLLDLKEKGSSYPYIFNEREDWEEVLQHMAYLFKRAAVESDEEVPYPLYSDGWKNEVNKKEEERCAALKKGFEMLVEYFDFLWD